MRILAGIDEAGLGPTIGPLATASAALLVPAHWDPAAPWRELAGAVAPGARKNDSRIAVADSKAIHAKAGLAGFEKTLGAFSSIAYGAPCPVRVSGDGSAPGRHQCYGDGDPFPAHSTPEDIDAAAALLRTALAEAGAQALHLEAALLYEPELNSRFAGGLNKNEALLIETGRHLSRLDALFPERPILVVVDKQGGRNAYLPFLTSLFPGRWIQETEAGRERSRYIMKRPGGDVDIVFAAKADRDSFATALASVAAKYQRECAMAQVNRWFCSRRPEVKPTAGYPEDAKRWLGEIRVGGEELRIEMVVRER